MHVLTLLAASEHLPLSPSSSGTSTRSAASGIGGGGGGDGGGGTTTTTTAAEVRTGVWGGGVAYARARMTAGRLAAAVSVTTSRRHAVVATARRRDRPWALVGAAPREDPPRNRHETDTKANAQPNTVRSQTVETKAIGLRDVYLLTPGQGMPGA